MSGKSFSLIPFPGPNLPAVTIVGRISLQKDLLSIHYALEGRLEDVLLPPASRGPQRKDELWKATCFEFFLAIKDQPGYWEFNIAPSGDWNVYRMDAYRRMGFRVETRISQLRLQTQSQSNGYLLDAAVDLTPIIIPGQELQMGITAILQTKGAIETYWALAHPASKPDFHLRTSFILSLVEQIRPVEQFALDD